VIQSEERTLLAKVAAANIDVCVLGKRYSSVTVLHIDAITVSCKDFRFWG